MSGVFDVSTSYSSRILQYDTFRAYTNFCCITLEKDIIENHESGSLESLLELDAVFSSFLRNSRVLVHSGISIVIRRQIFSTVEKVFPSLSEDSARVVLSHYKKNGETSAFMMNSYWGDYCCYAENLFNHHGDQPWTSDLMIFLMLKHRTLNYFGDFLKSVEILAQKHSSKEFDVLLEEVFINHFGDNFYDVDPLNPFGSMNIKLSIPSFRPLVYSKDFDERLNGFLALNEGSLRTNSH